MLSKVDVLAFFAAGLIVGSYGYYNNSIKEHTPSTDFFSVREINIPDFVEGSDPVMVYDRTIKKDFLGTFVVEVHKAEKSANYSVCSNSATRTYKAGEKAPETVTLDWFIDRKCGLSPGQYVVETTWKIEADGYPDKEYSAVSNVFRVVPKGAQTYVTPEQVQQLEMAKELLENPIPLVGGSATQ